MKKKVFIILTVMLLLLSGCNDANELSQGTDNNITGDTSATEDNLASETTSTEIEQTTVVYSLDAEYEEAIQQCKSNAEKTSTNEFFATKWYNLVETYYNCTLIPRELPYDDELLNERYIKEQEDIRIIHENWEIYVQQRLKNEENRLKTIYMTGSIVPVLLSYFKYDLYRLHAIEMYKMCEEAFISCPQP